MIDKTIFKAYDIRGEHPNQINQDVAYQIGRAFVDFLKVKQVAVGYDMRLSSPELKAGLFQALADAGVEIIDLGMIGTEMLHFAVGYYKLESGIMITASHNPPKYNGMKMDKANAVPIGNGAGMEEIAELAATKTYDKLNASVTTRNLDVYADLKHHLSKFVDFNTLAPLKIVVDAGNGMGGIMFSNIFKDTKLQVVPLFFDPDGSFPNHEANPAKEENVAQLRRKVVEEKADLGIAMDGDGDRVFFIDENGSYTFGYFLVSILAKEALKRYPRSNIVYEGRLSWSVLDTIEEFGGNPVISKSGHSFLKAKMREFDSPFSGENSCHFYYRDMFFTDSSMLTVAYILKILSEQNIKLSELLAPYKAKYHYTPEINIKVDDANTVFDKIKAKYLAEGYELNELDGIIFDNDREWHFSLRKSNTEPLVRLNVEAKSPELVNQMVAELEQLIGGHREGH